tara:strand:+ start:1138 stop:1365 length:228 start_codon:yes stop_codon:yes gene_type:complete
MSNAQDKNDEHDTREALKYHPCQIAGSWAEYDGRGIYLTRVCPECEEAKMSQYRPEILRYYTQADVDEPIEPEDN